MPDPITSSEPRSDMREVIIRGMQRRGWSMLTEGEGTIRTKITLRAHSAILDISYTDTVISFEHVSSTNLRETATTIHSNYIGWVNNLRRDIVDELLMKSMLSEGDGGS